MGDKMKTLYLLRHAKSSWDDSRVSDFDRPLNNRGRREAEKIAEYMKENKYIPEYIICSTAKRTRETLDLILNIIKFGGEVIYLDNLYLASSSGIEREIDSIRAESLLVVGHNPGIEDYLSNLVGEELIMKTSHLAVIDFEKKILKDFVRPRDFGGGVGD
ncbi:MAG: histidine phosphatase family protein [Tissierellia bacterium]|nr:histidine phosphatase family protein [Tissierellia bacterium]